VQMVVKVVVVVAVTDSVERGCVLFKYLINSYQLPKFVFSNLL
jgi:hypothetical protein